MAGQGRPSRQSAPEQAERQAWRVLVMVQAAMGYDPDVAPEPLLTAIGTMASAADGIADAIQHNDIAVARVPCCVSSRHPAHRNSRIGP